MKGASGRWGSQNEGSCAKSATGKAGVLVRPTLGSLEHWGCGIRGACHVSE
jgi:hypothetical protein